MGYAGYFLIVADFVRFAREQRIATTCRGSAPGSIVTYTLGITPVDPIHYQLPFERFLNPDRVTMPDIDVDFEDSRRDEVIAYVTRKYGSDHVAQIITFGTMLARAAIRDVGRVLGMGYGEVDRIAKACPTSWASSSRRRSRSRRAARHGDGDPGRKLIDLAQQLEGVAATHRPTPRAWSSAATADRADAAPEGHQLRCADDPVRDARRGSAGPAQVRLPGAFQPDHPAPGRGPRSAASAGVAIDIDQIPLDDTKTFELLASGETTGVFQLESAGMRRYIRDLRPTSVYDLAAMVALFRPGPMDNIPAYIRRKHGQEPVTYLHPLLEPFLEKTYGIFVYQEDIMAAAIALGGFTGPEADTLGYAIRKKKSAVLRAQKGKFVTQAAERGVAAAVIDAVFKAFEPFERYGFNKAHATCYGLIAYQTAYLKANYPVEYMASVLTAFRDNTEKVAAAIAECRRLGIAVLPPDIHAAAPLHGRGRGHPLRAAGGQERGPGRHRVDRRRARGGRRLPLARRPLRAGRPAPRQQAGRSSRWPRSARFSAFGHAAQVLLGLDDAIAYGAGGAARPAVRPGLAVRLTWRGGRQPGAAAAGRRPRRRRGNGRAGRRSCSACTSPITRWATSRRRWAATSTPGPRT